MSVEGDATGPGASPVAAQSGASQPVIAGVVLALVGFCSTFALVLAGLRAVGADAEQAASGLLVLCVMQGAVAIWLGLRYRMPIATAWSTPGAALLISAGAVGGGWPAAVGAFLVSGTLIVLVALWRPLERGIAAIPATLASAMLAGVLLPVCVAPVKALAEIPDLAGPGRPPCSSPPRRRCSSRRSRAWRCSARSAARWPPPRRMPSSARPRRSRSS